MKIDFRHLCADCGEPLEHVCYFYGFPEAKEVVIEVVPCEACREELAEIPPCQACRDELASPTKKSVKKPKQARKGAKK